MANVTAVFDAEARAGSRVLSLLSNPLNAMVLRTHAEGPQRLAEVREKSGNPARTTLRAAVTSLREVGALAKRPVGRRPYGVATELTGAGKEMLAVADEVEVWLARAPGGPIAPESDAARDAVRALAVGWSSTVVRALASRPFTLSELDRQIPGVSYPSLERRLASMRTIGQIEPIDGPGRATPYLATDWLRRAIAPLCCASRCELRHLEDSPPVTSVEVEAAFMLTVPLAPLPGSASGTAVLAVQTHPEAGEDDSRLAGVTVEVEGDKAASCVVGVGDRPGTWAMGTPEAWLDAVIDGRFTELRFGGADPQLAADLVSGVRFALFLDR